MKQLVTMRARFFMGFAVVALALACAGQSRAQGIVPANQEVIAPKLEVRTEHNVVKDGRNGMNFHLTFQVDNARGLPCEVLAFFFQNGKAVRAIDKGFSNLQGDMCTFLAFTPKFDKTTLTGTLFMPYDAMVAKAGQVELDYIVNVYCSQAKKYVGVKPCKGTIVLSAVKEANEK